MASLAIQTFFLKYRFTLILCKTRVAGLRGVAFAGQDLF